MFIWFCIGLYVVYDMNFHGSLQKYMDDMGTLRNQLFSMVELLFFTFQASVMAKYLVDAKIAVDPRWFLWKKNTKHINVVPKSPVTFVYWGGFNSTHSGVKITLFWKPHCEGEWGARSFFFEVLAKLMPSLPYHLFSDDLWWGYFISFRTIVGVHLVGRWLLFVQLFLCLWEETCQPNLPVVSSECFEKIFIIIIIIIIIIHHVLCEPYVHDLQQIGYPNRNFATITTKTNSLSLKVDHSKRKGSYSNHPFSRANLLFVSGRVYFKCARV